MSLLWAVNEEERHALEASWLAFRIKHADMETIAAWWLQMEKRYAEPHRHYHSLGHVRDILQYVMVDAVVAAAWFHDIVFDPARADNEEQSARVAAVALREMGFSVQTIEMVMQMIRATGTRDPRGLPQPALLLLDADVAVFGSHHERYVAYRDAIRQEYAFVPEEQFVERRRELVERFLMRPYIYFTDVMREQFEQQARTNLEWELASITSSPQTL